MLGLFAFGGWLFAMPLLFFGFALLIFFMVFWIWMLVDCIMNQHLSGGERLLWALLIFFLHTIGAVIYFFVARSRKRTAVAT